jgi:hypothetical protein
MPKDHKEDTKQASGAWQVISEIEFTDRLQRVVDYYNLHYFRNFTLRLVMDQQRG